MPTYTKNNPPIFIVGAPRCGTTLTARILGRHPRIFMPGENHFFEDIYARRQELGPPDTAAARTEIMERLSTLYGRYNQNEDQERIDKLLADPDIRKQLNASFSGYRSILDAFMQVQLQATPKSRWGNNTPKDLFHVDEILSFYPDARFIVCVRDVRDFLLSYKDRWKVTTSGHRARLRELYHPMITSLLWKSSMRQVAALSHRIPAGNMVISKYEDLVRDPAHAVQRMCACIGEKFEPDMLNISTHNSSDPTRRTGIFTSSVSRWRGRLTNEEAFLAQWLTRNELSGLGYRQARIEISPVKLAAILAASPHALIKALAANKDKRGPLIPYLVKRTAALLSKAD
jgi:hypothetical protein